MHYTTSNTCFVIGPDSLTYKCKQSHINVTQMSQINAHGFLIFLYCVKMLTQATDKIHRIYEQGYYAIQWMFLKYIR